MQNFGFYAGSLMLMSWPSICCSLNIIIIAFPAYKTYIFFMLLLKKKLLHVCSKLSSMGIPYFVKLVGTKRLLEIGQTHNFCISWRLLLEMLILCGNCGFTAIYPPNWILISWPQQSASPTVLSIRDCASSIVNSSSSKPY